MKKFNIVKNRKVFYIIALVLIIAGIVSMAVRGFNWDIDFTGGTAMTINLGKAVERADVEKVEELAIKALGERASSVQKTGADGHSVIIKVTVQSKELTSEQRTALFNAVKEEYKLTTDKPDATETISATVGGELRDKAILSIVLAALLMLIYIWIRFEFRSGLSAVFALLFDIFIVISAYSILQIPVNTTFIAVILTILGYSINATIIVFDRIRENRKMLKAKEAFEDTVERSLWQTATRQINTTITTLLTITMVYILGVSSIKLFALPLIIGIISGLYSSLFLSSSLWVTFKKMAVGEKGAKIK